MSGKVLPIAGVKAVVFDKDGVLADSESINLRSAFEVFRAHGHELGPQDEPVIVGRHPLSYVPILARRFGVDPEKQRRMIAEQDRFYTEFWLKHGRLIDGTRETLDAVRRLNVGVGMATSSSRREVEVFLERFDLAACFDVTLTLDDVERAKPDPEVYLLAAEGLEVEPREMLVVEDSAHGVQAAKAAGAICVAVRSRHVSPASIAPADARIDSIADLPALFRL